MWRWNCKWPNRQISQRGWNQAEKEATDECEEGCGGNEKSRLPAKRERRKVEIDRIRSRAPARRSRGSNNTFASIDDIIWCCQNSFVTICVLSVHTIKAASLHHKQKIEITLATMNWHLTVLLRFIKANNRCTLWTCDATLKIFTSPYILCISIYIRYSIYIVKKCFSNYVCTTNIL